MGAKLGKKQKKKDPEYYQLSSNERTLIRNVWTLVESNTEFHGNAFFERLFKIHPQYTKYFMPEPQSPLAIDARVKAKFTMIMETLGYLVIDYQAKAKQLDHLVNYIAMVHKDMRLKTQDNVGFGIVDYLKEAFPALMDEECVDIYTKYIASIMNEMNAKMDEQRKNDLLNDNADFKRTHRFLKQCSRNSNRHDRLLYGQTIEYWQARRVDWNNKIEYWKSCGGIENEAVGRESFTEPDISKTTASQADHHTELDKHIPDSIKPTNEIIKNHKSDISEKIPMTMANFESVMDSEEPFEPTNKLSYPEFATSEQPKASTIPKKQELNGSKDTADHIYPEALNKNENHLVGILSPHERHRSRALSPTKLVSTSKPAVPKKAGVKSPVSTATMKKKSAKHLKSSRPQNKIKPAGKPGASAVAGKKKPGRVRSGHKKNDSGRVKKPIAQQPVVLPVAASSARQRRRASLERQCDPI